MASETLKFYAVLPDSSTAVNVGKDGAKIKLEIPQTEQEAYLRLARIGFNRLLRVSVEINTDPAANAPSPGQLTIDDELQERRQARASGVDPQTGEVLDEHEPYPEAGAETADEAATREAGMDVPDEHAPEGPEDLDQ